MKTVTVLGATGSIGRRTLELISAFPDQFRVGGLAARGSDVSLVAELVRAHRPAAVALLDRAAVDRLARELAPPRPELLAGAEGLAALATDVRADVVVSAMVGAAGLVPTLGAIRAGRTIALANKETLVMAGALMTRAARERGVRLLPVDSEHSAALPVPGRRGAAGSPPARPDRVGRAVPRMVPREARGGHGRAGAATTRPGGWARRSPSTRPR